MLFLSSLVKAFTTLAICASLYAVSVESASEDQYGLLVSANGECGDTLDWSLDTSSQTLTINGTGKMDDFSPSAAPWRSYANQIRIIEFVGDVTSIGAYAFYYLSILENITLPSSMASIGSSAFFGCGKLSSLFIPASVTYISSYGVFGSCSVLSNVTVDDRNTKYQTLDNVLFSKAGQLMFCPPTKQGDYEIPNFVKSIAFQAFSGCSLLTSVIIPDGVESIGQYGFLGCRSLTTVSIPASVTTIEQRPFGECSSLQSIEVDKNNKNFTSEDGVLFNKEKTTLVTCPAAKQGIYSVPDTVTTIQAESFYLCELTSVIIPASVVSMGDEAFWNCGELETVSYLGLSDPGGQTVFGNCFSLQSICVPIKYNSSEFCHKTNICRKKSCFSDEECFEGCDQTQIIENQCFESICNDEGEWSVVKRDNASAWEKKTNPCVEYFCDNNTGPVSRSKCSDGVCVEDHCFADKNPNKQWSVNITLDDVSEVVTTVDTSGIIESICALTGLKSNEMTVGIQRDGNGNIINIIVYVDDENSAQTITKTMNNLEKGSNCPHGILCRTKNAVAVRVKGENAVSMSYRYHSTTVLCLIVTATALIVV